MSREKAKKILIVDDERDILECLTMILEEEGYSVVPTVDGEYLEKLQIDDLPDLILLDVLLSGKDGRELVKYLKTQKETRSIPVIVISAHPTAEASALEAGADLFLAKPFDLSYLLNNIGEFIYNA
jgi:CheY-like chemotaxis protein